MDFDNIPLNQLLDSICDDTQVRIVSYETDKIEFYGKSQDAFSRLQNCNFDIVGIELWNGAIEITIKTIYE